MVSDGVPEARLADGELYGDERLSASLSAGPASEGGSEMGTRALSAVASFRSSDLVDDVTVPVVERAA